MKKRFASFMALILTFSVGWPLRIVSAKEVNIDVNTVKMLFVDAETSKTPTLSNSEHCVFQDDNTTCNVIGRIGSSYFIIFGETTSAERFVGNRDNTFQGSDNLRGHYQVRLRIDKKKTIEGMDAYAHYVKGLSNVKNGVWGVALDFPTENVNVTSEVEYNISVTLKDLQNSSENEYLIRMKLMPPEEINRSAVVMCTDNTIEIKYANSAKISATGLTRMRKTKKRDYTIEFPNEVTAYIPRIVTQKTECIIGGGFDTCPEMEDRARKSTKSMFFATVAGTMSDVCTLSYPIEEAFDEDADGAKLWIEGKKAYAYPLNLTELAKKTKLTDKTNLIDFDRVLETTVKEGKVSLNLINGSIDVANEIYIVTLNPLSSSEFPTKKVTKSVKKTSTTTAKTAASKTSTAAKTTATTATKAKTGA